jgi:hypothetical protein
MSARVTTQMPISMLSVSHGVARDREAPAAGDIPAAMREADEGQATERIFHTNAEPSTVMAAADR